MKTTYHLSHSQLLWVALFLLTFGLIAIYVLNTHFGNSQQVNAAGINAQAVTSMIRQGEDLNAASNTLIADINTTHASQTAVQTQTPETLGAAWQAAGNKSGTPQIPLSDKITQYQIIEIETHPKSLPLVGQAVTFPLFDGKAVSALVKTIHVHPNSDYSWRGHLQAYGSEYPVTMTYGQQGVFASITTPEGSYSMESQDGLGWLYKNPAEPELTLPGNSDFVEPPID
jgi:hypothetical protein